MLGFLTVMHLRLPNCTIHHSARPATSPSHLPSYRPPDYPCSNIAHPRLTLSRPSYSLLQPCLQPRSPSILDPCSHAEREEIIISEYLVPSTQPSPDSKPVIGQPGYPLILILFSSSFRPCKFFSHRISTNHRQCELPCSAQLQPSPYSLPEQPLPSAVSLLDPATKGLRHGKMPHRPNDRFLLPVSLPASAPAENIIIHPG